MKDIKSRYNITVKTEHKALLFNSLTGKLIAIDNEEYSVIEALMNNLSVFREKHPKLFTSFKHAGFIISDDFNELEFIKYQNHKKVYTERNYRIAINPTLSCNLNCWYCSVKSAGAKRSNERMSDDVVSHLKRHLNLLISESNIDSIILDWFGGEPTLYYNEVMKPISDYFIQLASNNIKLKYYYQQITTNASLLNENRIKEMRDACFKSFQITIDGNRKRHNEIKYNSNKIGTYDKIIENLNLISKHIPDATIFLRINFDKTTLNGVEDIIKDLSKEAKKQVTVSFQRVWQITLDESDIQQLKYIKNIFEQAGMNCSQSIYRTGTFKRCYADSYHFYVINYDGLIYKCTARDYSDKLCVGKLESTGDISWNSSLLSKYYSKATFENELCLNCKILPICMGPCIQINLDNNLTKQPIKCILRNYEYSVEQWIIDLAKNNKII